MGLAAQAGLERLNQTERPPLRKGLASIPKQFGDWVGWDEPVSPDIVPELLPEFPVKLQIPCILCLPG